MAQLPPVSSHVERLEGFADFVQAMIEEWKLPGVAIGLVKDGEVVLAQGFGKRDREAGQDMTPQTICGIASCTKAFTAMALAMLVDEGKLDWDTPLRNYLPDFRLSDSVASERITTRDILSHRTGLPGHDLVAYGAELSAKEMLKRLPHLEMNRDIRTTWQYNNLMYGIAGYLIQCISGQSWDEFVRQRILVPLGMKRTSFTIAEVLQMPDYAMPYKLADGEILQRTEFYRLVGADAPAGAINSNVEDMTKWLRCLLNKTQYGEGQRLVSEEQFQQLTGPQMIMPPWPYQTERYTEESRMCYAFGWWTYTYRGHRLVQHSGGIDGFSVLTTFLPDDNLGVVVLTNREAHLVPVHGIFTYNACDRLLGLDEVPWNERTRLDYTRLKEQVEKGKREAEAKRVANAPLSHAPADYTGQYEHPAYGIFQVQRDGESFKGLHNGFEYSFTHLHYDTFLAHLPRFDLQLKASFATNLDGEIESLALPLEPEVKPIIFKRIPDLPGGEHIHATNHDHSGSR